MVFTLMAEIMRRRYYSSCLRIMPNIYIRALLCKHITHVRNSYVVTYIFNTVVNITSYARRV